MKLAAATAGTLRDASAARPDERASATRRLWWCAVVLLVLIVHGALKLWVDEALIGWGLGSKPMPPRLEVAFVRTLTPSAVPPPAVRPLPARRAGSAQRVSEAASAVQPSPPPSEALPVPVPLPEAAVAADIEPKVESTAAASPAEEIVPAPPAAEPAAAAASAPAAPASDFEWPPSTRLTYGLSGNYRGEVNGSARVQWVRLGSRYQVHLDVMVGPSFAPLMSRRMTSDGELGSDGLTPRRYDEVTKLPFQNPRRAGVEFAPRAVTLANGSQREPLPGVQDAASQFVQLTWMFTLRPELLRVGNAIMVPLALPRRMDRWVYDVVGEERLSTPVGPLGTFHLKPRRADDRPRGELSAEIWIAPTLQYLPVRIRIQQDADTFVDMVMDRAPLQAEPDR